MFGGPEARFEWGAAGARVLALSCDAVVVVDVLSFTTSVVIAAGRGTELFPCADAHDGRRIAEATGSELAVSRDKLDALHPWSLSPASISAAPTAERLVLPSPNGSAISAIVGLTGTPVVAACLRNAAAVARYLLDHADASGIRAIGVVAAGERWADGSLRPAIEDLLGAGLVLAGLRDEGVALTPEATVAARSAAGLAPESLADLVRGSTSGRELTVAGYREDVEIAVAVDVDAVVPLMESGSKSFSGRASPV
jgi:2-phosphosulfolactate phosphatase